MKRVIAIVTVCVMLFCLNSGQPVSAETDTDQVKTEIDILEEEKAKIDEKLNALQVQYDAHMSKLEKLVAEKAVIDQEIALLYDKMDNINQQIAAYSAMIAEKQEQLQAAQEQLSTLQQEYRERIRAMEENGRLTYWEVIFQANSFADLLDRLNMMEEIDRADRMCMEKISLAADQVKTVKEELEGKKAELEETRVQLTNTQQQMEEKRKESDQKLQELLSMGEEYRKYIEEQEAKASQLQGQIDEKEGLLSQLEKEEYDKWLETQKPENESGNQTGSNTVNGITWIVPINYTYLASPYGMRIHPLEGIWKMHNGVDLDAPMNTPIYASRSGKVYYRGWWGTGGNTIMINHQDGYISRYLHMESFAVANGEWVAAGQIIGYCGTTGGSSGPHLHFEIQYNGSYVNPTEYINIS